MTIREAILGDAGAVARLSTELGYPADSTAIAHRLARAGKRKDTIVLVADLGR